MIQDLGQVQEGEGLSAITLSKIQTFKQPYSKLTRKLLLPVLAGLTPDLNVSSVGGN